MAQPKVTLQYANPLIMSKYQQLEVAMTKLATNGVLAAMQLRNEEGRGISIDITLAEVRSGGLERAVSECIELFVPLSGVHNYNAEGRRITKSVLGQLGYELKKNSFLAGLFNQYLLVVRIPERIQTIVNST